MLEVKNLDVYVGRKKIVEKASFSVNKGAIVGLIGPNGAGKTTTMKTILGLTKFTGEIRIDGKNVTSNDHTSLEKVGALIEHPAIYPFMTGLENLKLYSRNSDDMENIINELEMKSYIMRKSKSYSLGMKQKLGIAIALLNKPEFVILDEPMNGLDVEATILVRNLIKKYSKSGTSFLISSHILSELERIISNVVIINDGQILLDETIDSFNKTFHRYFRIQTTDLEATLTQLDKNKIKFEKETAYLKIDEKDLVMTQKILYKNDIFLLDLRPITIDFEQKIVHLLNDKKVVSDA